MATEKYTTNGESTLNGGVDNSTTTWAVASGTSFPSSGTFRVRCEDEIVKVTARSGADLTVVRGQEGTSAASHADGTTVTEVLTAEALDQIRSDLVQTGAYASRPAAEKDGILYFPNNAVEISRDTGAAWASWGPMIKLSKQAYSGLTWVNQGSATGGDDTGLLWMLAPANGSPSVKILKKAATEVTGAWTFTATLMPTMLNVNYHRAGIIARENATGKFAFFGIGAGAQQYFVDTWNSPTSFGTTLINTNVMGTNFNFGVWLRIVFDGTNVKFLYSGDGLNFIQIYSAAKTTWFTTKPDEIGFGLDANYASVGIATAVLNWVEGA